MPQFTDPKSAFDWELTEVAGSLRRLSGGETGERLLWFVSMIKELQRMPETRTVWQGEWTGYRDVARLAVRRGATLTAERIPLRLAENAREEWQILKGLDTDLPLQIGVPGYLEMALFTFGPVTGMRLSGLFLRAVADQLAEIDDFAGDRAVFQLEVPVALIAVVLTPPPLRSAMASLMARLVIRQVSRAPEGTRFGVHLCLGDLGHKALRQMRNADPVVLVANAIARQWPAGRHLEFLHLPMSGGEVPPSTDPAFYRPLRKLRVNTQVIAGIAHEEQSPEDQQIVRDLFESALGAPVDIATSCGLGRRTPEQAWRAADRMRALLP